MRRRLIFCLALLIAVPLVAQTTHAVRRIEVVGGVPAAIVKSQSALTEGRSYSSEDLDVAVARLRRLPFVYDARYTVDGETLVIEVESVTRFFGDLDANGFGTEGDQSGSASLTGGARMFLGSGGVAQAHVRELVTEYDDAAVVDAEYAHYGIGGSRLFALGNVSYNVMHDEGADFDPTLRVLVGYPLTIRQTLTASGTAEGSESHRRPLFAPRELRSSSERKLFDLKWTYDTTDDPFFARRGLLVSAGPSWGRDETLSEAYSLTFPGLQVDIIPSRSESSSTALNVEALKLWTVGARGAVFAGLNGSRDRSHVESSFGDTLPFISDSTYESTSGAATLGYAYNLFDRGTAATRQRIEFGATYARTELDLPSQPFFPGADFTTDATILNVAYVLRRQFATVRLGLSYTFQDAVDQRAYQPAVPQQPTVPFPFPFP